MYLSAWFCGSLNVVVGSASEIAFPPIQVWFGVCVASTGAAAAEVAATVTASDCQSPQ